MSMLFPIRLLLLLIASISVLVLLCGFVSGQQSPSLPAPEVEALRAIGTRLGKTDWDFSVDPCGGGGRGSPGWSDPNPYEGDVKAAVTCDCTFGNNTICHVISIILKGLNLNGSLPSELTGLPFLREIDLTRNYLSGTIPRSWGSMRLANISLFGNRITGPIPPELGNISTLANLTLEHNQLSGPIPTELGRLPQLQTLLLSSNNLTGEIPSSLGSLTSLRNFSISDNNFTGQIPNFVQNWTNLQQLEMQASGLRGPIPPGIGFLNQLYDLRISDLSGNDSNFPLLNATIGLTRLILRSCNIIGPLPSYLGSMTTLKVLDLSFNKLNGSIPDTFYGLRKTDYIYLTGNSLSGPWPEWMQTDGDSIDLSYNNLTTDGKNCQIRQVNLFANSREPTFGLVSCSRTDFSCPSRRHSSLHINCGGGQVNVNKKIYEEDTESVGSSTFYRKTNWAVSSTGHFVGTLQSLQSFTNSTTSSISGENPELCRDARLSPLSLTYYAFCMMSGSYTVSLHFAEIMLTNDSTFNSLGRRVFDVYIQGSLVLKDFNIANEAGGVNVGIKKTFPAVDVNDGTLEIRLYWAGKGTSAITARGVYGPLISAISVDLNFKPPSDGGISGGAIAGIVVAVLFTVVLVLAFLWWKGCLLRKYAVKRDLKGVDLTAGSFTLRQIKAATNNFDPANKIGEGGFGPVYKGHLLDGTIIAVKQLSSKSKQGNREFVNEIGMISALQHPHLVKLYGCCIEGNQLLLVYEYMENNSLARVLFGPEEHQQHLDWPMRHKISIDIARGLAYLHEESRLKIVHRDIKATNVLLDKDFVAKISDFGLAKLDEEDNTHISTRVAGTYGYMAPEYAMRGYLTDKADVYSFGVVLLEIVSGRSNTILRTKDNSFYLLDWANSLKENGTLLDLVDPRLESNFNQKEVLVAIDLALQCTNVVAAERPSMSTVVSILEGKDEDLSSVSGQDVPNNKMKNHKNMSEDYSDRQITEVSVPWTGSSASTGDLYPITVNTDYWRKRDP